MMRHLTVFLLAITLSGNALADDLMRIVVFGDSLTSGYRLRPEEGFPGKLKQKLLAIGHKNIDVVNMSIPGNTTFDAKDRVYTVMNARPDIVIVAFGMNDVLRGVKPAHIYNYLGATISGLMANRERPVYVILVGIKAPDTVDTTYANALEKNYAALADHYKIPIYPDLLAGIAGHRELNLADEFHPNAKGTDVMVENLYRYVDAGIRWKWQINEEINYQKQLQEYERTKKSSPQPAAQ